jgi:pyruvate/2-oxoglutarate dehydrogenase complex dihydrolipoamide acyltransferase (E2) component
MKRLLLPFLPCLLAAQAAQAAQAAPEPAHIQVFQTTAKAVRRGDTVTLRWAATGADQVRLEPLGLILPAKGEITHLVTGRTVYWLNVSNAAGGQSVPLVVDLLPEAPAPAVATGPAALPPSTTPPALAPTTTPPALTPALPSPLPALPEAPKLANLPASPAPREAVLPAAAPAVRRLARHRGQRHAWIQFAATTSPGVAARLQGRLRRAAGTDATLVARRRRSGRLLQLVRNGPFPSVQAARLRLRELAPALAALHLRPVILVGPPQAVAAGDVYLADARQPGR